MHTMIFTTLLGATLMSIDVSANLAGAAELTIEVNDIKSADGSVRVALYNSAGAFLKKPLSTATVKAATGANTLIVKDLPEGEYAFAVYHDANANGKMDANLIGIPTEAYAFSNNAMGKMGPPDFNNAKFTLPAAGASTRVSVR